MKHLFSRKKLKPLQSKIVTITITTLTCLFVFFIPLACKKDTPPKKEEPKYKTMSAVSDSNFVDLSTATAYAKRINDNVFLNGASNTTTDKAIANYFEIPDSSGKTALYIFNFANNGGYVVLSADYRYEPVCAYVRQGNFDTAQEVPSMLGMWYYETVTNIQAIRNGVKGADTEIAGGQHDWMVLYAAFQFATIDAPLFDDPFSGCGASTYQVVNPLLTTSWGQGCGYNDLCPNSHQFDPAHPLMGGCTESNYNCNHDPTGCVATAMAQVIRYWAKADNHNYNYASMPNTYGNSEVQRLMHDAGTSVSMDYGCSESGADAYDIPYALANTFHLSYAVIEDYDDGDQWKIKADLDLGRPVIMNGDSEIHNWIFFKTTSGGHVWVCDGYKVEGNSCYHHFWWDMNWGWDGYENDWYYYSTWSNPAASFNYNKNFIHNIHRP